MGNLLGRGVSALPGTLDSHGDMSQLGHALAGLPPRFSFRDLPDPVVGVTPKVELLDADLSALGGAAMPGTSAPGPHGGVGGPSFPLTPPLASPQQSSNLFSPGDQLAKLQL